MYLSSNGKEQWWPGSVINIELNCVSIMFDSKHIINVSNVPESDHSFITEPVLLQITNSVVCIKIIPPILIYPTKLKLKLTN